MTSQPTIAYFIPALIGIMDDARFSSTELCYFCSLNSQLHVLSYKKFFSNSTSEISIKIREVTTLLVPETAYILILHNHPSQKPFPSRADLNATTTLVTLSELLNFKVLDHIIVTQKEYFSFAENGILKEIKIPYV